MDDLRGDLADIRNKLLVMVGTSEYRLPLNRYLPSENERTILLRLVELTEVVDRLADRVESRS
ncbi:hypothetical protein [Schumannella luteola]